MTTKELVRKPGSTEPDLQALCASAAWYVHHVRNDGVAEIVPMSLDSYRASSFLDHRIVRLDDKTVIFRNFSEFRNTFSATAANAGSFIFHISHVGSTLVSKILGVKPSVLALREPVMLRWLADLRRDIRLPESRCTSGGYEVHLRTALGFLARPLAPADRVVVKATSFANILAGDILSLQPCSNAIGLYCRFESFAATVLKGQGGWSDMLQQAPNRLRRLHEIVGRQPWLLAGMSPGEIVAVNWLAEMATLTSVARTFQGRFHMVDFDQFIEAPEANIKSVAGLLKLDWNDADDAEVERSGVLLKYSKSSDKKYSLDERRRDQGAVASLHKSEISRGRDWLNRAINENESLISVRPFSIKI